MKLQATPQQVHEIGTIFTRYSECHELATIARKAIENLKHSLFYGIIEDSEKDMLYKAIDAISKIEDNTTFHDAKKYTNQLLNN